jgi:hypothetical protein
MIALVWMDTDTGEVLRADGSAAGKWTPKMVETKVCPQMMHPGGCPLHNIHCAYPKCVAPMPADLAGCVVKLPARSKASRETYRYGFDDALDEIEATLLEPKHAQSMACHALAAWSCSPARSHQSCCPASAARFTGIEMGASAVRRVNT